jgi:hypothetical protein
MWINIIDSQISSIHIPYLAPCSGTDQPELVDFCHVKDELCIGHVNVVVPPSIAITEIRLKSDSQTLHRKHSYSCYNLFLFLVLEWANQIIVFCIFDIDNTKNDIIFEIVFFRTYQHLLIRYR